MRAAPNRRATAGFTLIEMAFAASIAAGLFFAVAYTTLRASKAYDVGQTRGKLVAQGHQVLDRIVRQLEASILASYAPTPPAGAAVTTLTFRQASGFAGGALLQSNQHNIALQLETGELNDGVDNNGNGLIDEGQIVWTQNVGQPDQTSVVLCHGVSALLQGEVANLGDDNGNLLVDEPGLVFVLQGNVLTIRLSLEAAGTDGQLVVKTVQTAVRIRN